MKLKVALEVEVVIDVKCSAPARDREVMQQRDSTSPTTDDPVTGLILAGGRAQRMGGAEKGLQLLEGMPLVRHVLDRLLPQVSGMLISANRHLDRYAEFGWPVLPDAIDDAGPLAGIAAGLAAMQTPWLVAVPCDSPRIPIDLVARLTRGLRGAPAAMAVTGTGAQHRHHAVCCLLSGHLRDPLAAYLAAGGRAVHPWLEHLGCAQVPFESEAAFVNVNTWAQLHDLERP